MVDNHIYRLVYSIGAQIHSGIYRQKSSKRKGGEEMFVDPISLLVATAPVWLPILRDTLLKSAGEQGGKWIFGRIAQRLTKRKELKHLEIVLRNAAEKGVTQFTTQQERDLYRAILDFLSEQGSDDLRRESLTLFTLSDSPDFKALTEKYNLRQRIKAYAQHNPYEEVDAAPYLLVFFETLTNELYKDGVFKDQIRQTIRDRAAQTTGKVLPAIDQNLGRITKVLAPTYSDEQFEQDKQEYASYIAMVYHSLRLPDVDPQTKNANPELDAIFVSQRIELEQPIPSIDPIQSSLVEALENSPNLVLLGGPGSGKSTATFHLAWSHATANRPGRSVSLAGTPLLSGKPLPIRIVLRDFNKKRTQRNDYSFFSYVIETQLKSQEKHIAPEMFKRLLKEKSLLFLFDGLDEVANPSERKSLSEDIGIFAESNPGNRFLVTSRLVGYQYSNFSYALFSSARILEFDDKQIYDFLQRWYTSVLKRFPISHKDQEELDTLNKTLQENLHLHVLASNPLLLTIITNLHREQRLPNKRVRVYDDCAEWLLEKWAALRGTNERWKVAKIPSDVQRDCIAHLGFVLHERVQVGERDAAEGETNSTGNYATLSFVRRTIENHLNQRNILFPSDRPTEAELFLELIQEETGLIVKQGTDESGEDLYGFVHSTFQEYFAAMDVFYRQADAPLPYAPDEDANTILNKFLRQHLHDPHWQEVILLLFGKLQSARATNQLQYILESEEGKGCRLSRYKEIVQQDLFFACTCLSEDVTVQATLAKNIILLVRDCVQNSVFPSQRAEALAALGSLVRIQQYSSLAQEALITLVTEGTLLDIPTRIQAAQTLYQCSPNSSEAQEKASQTLLNLAQQSNMEYAVRATQAIYECYPVGSQERLNVVQMFLDTVQRSGVPFEQTVKEIRTFLERSSTSSEESQLAIRALLNLIHHPGISIAQAILVMDALLSRANQGKVTEWQIVADKLLELVQGSSGSFEEIMQVGYNLYNGPVGSQGRRRGAQLLLDFIPQSGNLTFEQAMQVAEALDWSGPDELDERQQITRMLLDMMKRPDLSFEQKLQTAEALYRVSPNESEEQRQAIQHLLAIAKQSGLSFEQTTLAAEILYQISLPKFGGWQQITVQATRMLFELGQQSTTSIEQVVQIVDILHKASLSNLCKAEEVLQALQRLWVLLEQTSPTTEQEFHVASVLYQQSAFKSQERQKAADMLWQLAENHSLSRNRRLQIVTLPVTITDANYAERARAVRTLLTLIEKGEARHHLARYWQSISPLNNPEPADIPAIVELTQQEILPTEARDEMYQYLRKMVPQFDKINSFDAQPLP